MGSSITSRVAVPEGSGQGGEGTPNSRLAGANQRDGLRGRVDMGCLDGDGAHSCPDSCRVRTLWAACKTSCSASARGAFPVLAESKMCSDWRLLVGHPGMVAQRLVVSSFPGSAWATVLPARRPVRAVRSQQSSSHLAPRNGRLSSRGAEVYVSSVSSSVPAVRLRCRSLSGLTPTACSA